MTRPKDSEPQLTESQQELLETMQKMADLYPKDSRAHLSRKLGIEAHRRDFLRKNASSDQHKDE